MGEAELSRFVTCRCQHCGGHIEFDATALDKEEKRGIECPHCRQTTVICAPTQSFPESQSKKLDRWEFKRALPLALIFVIAVGIAAFFLLKPKFSEKLQTDQPIARNIKPEVLAAYGPADERLQVVRVIRQGVIVQLYDFNRYTKQYQLMEGMAYLLKNHPKEKELATGDTVDSPLKAVRVGVFDYKDATLPVYDCRL